MKTDITESSHTTMRRWLFTAVVVVAHIFSIRTTYAQGTDPFYLSFPLPNKTPESVQITSVFDHSKPGDGVKDGIVVAFTGEKGEKQYGFYMDSYKQADGNKEFRVNGNYVSDSSGKTYLTYDGHNGFDFVTTGSDQIPVDGTRGHVQVLAAAGGIAHIDDPSYGQLRIDHDEVAGVFYSTYYTHLSQFGDVDNKRVERGQVIGIAGDKGAEGHPHLHFGVKKNGKDGIRVDPYGWEGVDSDPYTDAVSIRLWQPAPSQGQIVPITPNGIIVSGAYCTIDDKPIGKTGPNGISIPWYLAGWHQVTLQIGKLYRSLPINFTGGGSQSNLQSSARTLAIAQAASSNTYEVELVSNSTCTGLGPVNNFAVGDRVEIYGTGNGLRARYPDPCSDAYAVMPDLSVGTIVGSWQCCSGYIRWKIRYDGLPGIDVWSAEAEPSTGQLFLRKKQNSTCSYSIAPARLDLDTAGAAASSFIVNTSSSCYWNAVTNSNWITITSNASGYGSNQVTFSVVANTGSGSRVGQISVADQTFTIAQAGTNSLPSGGGILALGLNETFVARDATSGSMAIYNKGGGTINWSASTTTSWLMVTTPTGIATVNGGTLSFNCQPNTAGSQRVGTIVVSAPGAVGSPQTLTVTQGGSDTANITISNLAVPANASAGSNVSVTWSQNSPFAQSNVVFLLTLYPNGQAPEPRALTKYLPVTVPAGNSSFNTNYDLPSDLYSGPYDVEVSLWSDANHDGVYDSGDILLGTFRKAAAMYVNGVPPKPAPVTVSDLSVPQSASAGDNVSVTWTDNSPYSQPNVLFRLTLYPAGQTNFRFDLAVPYLAITIPGGGSSFNTTFQLPSNLYSGIYDAEVSLWSDQDGIV